MPTQVGKTTISRRILEGEKGNYLNWDVIEHRETILKGQSFVLKSLPEKTVGDKSPILILDEIHKYKDWKNYLKGLYDQSIGKVKIIVTGSSKLDLYQKGGDSLMGRYFPYRVFPISVGESVYQELTESVVRMPIESAEDNIDTLFKFGGFPDPYLKSSSRFHNQWQKIRHQQLFSEDILSLSKVSDLAQLEVLAKVIENQIGQQINYSNLAKKIRVSDQTIRRWFDLLESTYYCFRLSPWSKNIPRSLIKEPKVFMWDWSLVKDEGAKFENFIATHLLKATSFWTDNGFGDYELFYLRDKEQREVDFIVTKDQKPWFLVEAKKMKTTISPQLAYFQNKTNAAHAFQVSFNIEFSNKDCFSYTKPVHASAASFLSQLP